MSDDVQMDPATARMILAGLIEGLNPFTGEPVEAGPCLDPDTVAALTLAVDALDKAATPDSESEAEPEQKTPPATATRKTRKPRPPKDDPPDELTLF